MEITVKGDAKEIAILVVGLQERQKASEQNTSKDEGERESMIEALEQRLSRLKANQPLV